MENEPLSSTILKASKDELLKLATKHNLPLVGNPTKSEIQMALLSTLNLLNDGATASPVVSDVSIPIKDLDRFVKFIPIFEESDIENYFTAFEKNAVVLSWDKTIWSFLVQIKFVGKARQVYLSLPDTVSSNYYLLKKAILKAYDLVPESYRTSFRANDKKLSETHVEFVQRKRVGLTHWIRTSNVSNMDDLKNLFIAEQFMNSLTVNKQLYLKERCQDVSDPYRLAQIIDEYDAIHNKSCMDNQSVPFSYPSKHLNSNPPRQVKCYNCQKIGHISKHCSMKKKYR